jgi:hypothetical protein
MGAKSTTPKPLRSDTPSQPPPGLEAALFRIGIRRQREQSYQRLVVFAEKVAGLKGALGRLANQPDQKSDGPDSMVVDMIANGDRQAVRGNFDEAALRYGRGRRPRHFARGDSGLAGLPAVRKGAGCRPRQSLDLSALFTRSVPMVLTSPGRQVKLIAAPSGSVR